MSERNSKTTDPTWTEGICGDGAAILRNGVPVTISDLLTALNMADEVVAACKSLIETGGEDDDLIVVGRLIAAYEGSQA